MHKSRLAGFIIDCQSNDLEGAYVAADVIDMDTGARQRLLASRSASARLRDVEMLMAPAVEALEARAVVHTRAKSNGHGPQPQSPG